MTPPRDAVGTLDAADMSRRLEHARPAGRSAPCCLSPRRLAGAWAQALRLAARWLMSVSLGLCLAGPSGAQEAQVALGDIQVERREDGLFLSFSARFELPPAVEDALHKGLPLHFLAEVQVTRERWYWSDKRVAESARRWRLAYQPLTRRYRISFGGLSQEYDELAGALAALQRTLRWQIASAEQLRNESVQRVMLNYRLDTAALPRPFQIGITGVSDWNLSGEATILLNDQP